MSACRFLYPCKFTYIKFKKNFLRRAFRLAKSSVILLTSSFRASAFSIDKTARPLNLSSCALEVFLNDMRYINPRFTYFTLLTYIMFRRYILINFNLENDLSAVATVTGNVGWWAQGSWALVHRTTCTTCMAATDYVLSLQWHLVGLRVSVIKFNFHAERNTHFAFFRLCWYA